MCRRPRQPVMFYRLRCIGAPKKKPVKITSSRSAFVTIKIMMWQGLVVPDLRLFNVIAPAAEQADWLLPLCTFLSLMLMVNVGLAIFNLIPIPPLDGSHVLETLLPERFKPTYEALQPYSWIILLALLWLGVFGIIITPVRNFVLTMLWGI